MFFALHLAGFFGVPPSTLRGELAKEKELFFDLKEGVFIKERPTHPHFIEDKAALITAEILSVRQSEELAGIKLNHDFRRNLLFAYETYYTLHIQEFGTMKSLPVLKEILS